MFGLPIAVAEGDIILGNMHGDVNRRDTISAIESSVSVIPLIANRYFAVSIILVSVPCLLA